MSLAYHDRRMPAGLGRADYHVSSNVGRTIQACRQSVIDARCCLDWLSGKGYRRLGILGTSLGSCIAFIVAAHDARLRAGVFNHVSMYFGDVVWTGLATRHVREGFGDNVTQEDLREYWRPISPATYLGRMSSRGMASLLVWARHDTTFLPQYSKQFVSSMFETGCPVQVASLPCGHYTTGEFPFNLIDAFVMCRFLSRSL
jgi:amino acid permease